MWRVGTANNSSNLKRVYFRMGQSDEGIKNLMGMCPKPRDQIFEWRR